MLKNLLTFFEKNEKKIFFLLIVFLLSRATALLINHSESLEGHVFLLLKGWSYGVGDIVGIDPHFLKKVGGVEGDKICIKENEIYVGKTKIGPLFEKNSKGAPLHPLQEKEIPKGKVFVYGTHPKSFDSRYLEFGLIPEDQINGKVIRIF